MNDVRIWEKWTVDDGRQKVEYIFHGSPVCRCGSRRTARRGESALVRFCYACQRTFTYRLVGGLLTPFAPETAAALEEVSRV